MGLVGSYPCVGDKIASLVLVFYFGVALGSGSNTQALYILNIKKKQKTKTPPARRATRRKPSNSDQTGHVNGDLRQQGLFELPSKQTVNELVRVCRAPCGKGPAPHSAPVGLVLETLVLPSPVYCKKKSLLVYKK